jgi:hypothetical protein
VTDPAAIVRALAWSDPTADSSWSDGPPYCPLCGTEDWKNVHSPVSHEAGCPWRQAVEWVASNGGSPAISGA